MLKYILMFVFVASCAHNSNQTALNNEVSQQPIAGSIDQVASQYIEDLCQDQQFRLFKFELPAGAVLPDHRTGPRMIVLLSELNGERIKDNSPVTAKANQAFYLTNTFSAGFKNVAEKSASYLVLSLEAEKLLNQNMVCPENFQVTLENSPVQACISLKDQTLEPVATDKAKRLLFNSAESKARLLTGQGGFQVGKGDWLFLLPPVSLKK